MGEACSHLSEEERQVIQIEIGNGTSIRRIGLMLGRNASTVGREIKLFLVKSVFRVSSLIFFGFRHEECRPVVCFTGCPSCRT